MDISQRFKNKNHYTTSVLIGECNVLAVILFTTQIIEVMFLLFQISSLE